MNATNNVLIGYYSLTGNTARVARDLAARLHAEVESIQDPTQGPGRLRTLVGAFNAWRKKPTRIAPLRHDPADYAVTIVGTPVWMGAMTPAVRGYLMQIAGRARSVAFFVTSGGTGVEKVLPSVEALAGHKVIASAGFNGGDLRDTVAYEKKLSAFVEEITRAGNLPSRAA